MKTIDQIAETVRLRCGSVPTDDPIWTDADNGFDFVNQAQNFLALRTLRGDRKRLNLFTKLRSRWHVETAADDASFTIPADCLTIEDIYSYDTGTGEPEPDENLTKRRKVTWVPEDSYESYPHTDEPTGFPYNWTRMADEVYVAPTPGTEYETWLLVKGLQSFPALATGDSPTLLGDLWLGALEDAAAYLCFKAMGFDNDAQVALAALDTSITNTVDILGMERTKRTTKVRFRGMPRG